MGRSSNEQFRIFKFARGHKMSGKSPVISVDTGILLEAGTNEVEVLVFETGEQRFGVNVAKVRRSARNWRSDEDPELASSR